ncbi:hypothetical protein [Embleya sp. NPDC059237]|uniref:hypothetical protein n=1 Tax=Embleya sp. NPDC059237 TaxID=3346784 RepID=UPI0036C0B672
MPRPLPRGTRAVARALHGVTPDDLRTPDPAPEPAAQLIALIVAAADTVDHLETGRAPVTHTATTRSILREVSDAPLHPALRDSLTDARVVDARLHDAAGHLDRLLAAHNATPLGGIARPEREPDLTVLGHWLADSMASAMAIDIVGHHPAVIATIGTARDHDPMAELRRVVVREAALLDGLDRLLHAYPRDRARDFTTHDPMREAADMPPFAITGARHLDAAARFRALLDAYARARTHLRGRPGG